MARESDHDAPSDNVRRLGRFTAFISTAHSIAAFTSFLCFLLNGKYRTLLDRVLRLRLTPSTNQVSREVSFEYLNRQLVWHAFTEFLLFLLPLVGISRWRRWLNRAWRKTTSAFRSGSALEEKTGGELYFLPQRTCAICYQDQNPTSNGENELLAMSGASGGVVGSVSTDITNPYETIACGCVYCYVCLAQRIDSAEGEGWLCLRCGELVRECKPWNGDVLEEAQRPRSDGSGSGSSKSVRFDEEAVTAPEESVQESLE